MKDAVRAWLITMPPIAGVLACGVCFPDQTSLSQSYLESFPVVALEHAWRSIADTLRVLTVHRLPATRLRWIYEQAELHCVRRSDNLILALFVTPHPAELDVPGMEDLFASFLDLRDAV